MIIVKYGKLDNQRIKAKCPECETKVLLDKDDYKIDYHYFSNDHVIWECPFCEEKNDQEIEDPWYMTEAGIGIILAFIAIAFVVLFLFIIPIIAYDKEKKEIEQAKIGYEWIVNCHIRGESNSNLKPMEYYAIDKPTEGEDFFVFNWRGEKFTAYFDYCDDCVHGEAYYKNPSYNREAN